MRSEDVGESQDGGKGPKKGSAFGGRGDLGLPGLVMAASVMRGSDLVVARN